MKRFLRYGLALSAALLILPTFPAQGGYGRMKKEFESYRPSGLYDAAITDRETGRDTPPLASDDFDRQMEDLRQTRVQWQEKIPVLNEGDTFFIPDPERLNNLRAIAGDTGKTAALLENDLDLKDLEILVLLRSPAVRAGQENLKAALESISQVENLEEILRRYTAFSEALMNGVGPMKGKTPAATSFPFPGVSALKGRIAVQEVIMASEQLEITRRTVLTSARSAYWNLVFNDKAVAIHTDMVALLRHLETVARARYETGQAGFQDLVQVRIKRETIEEERITLLEKELTLEALLRQFLELPAEVRIGKPLAPENPDYSTPALQDLYQTALASRQELRKTRAMINRMEMMIELGETMVLPPFTLNLSRFEDEAVLQTGTLAKKETFPVTVSASMGAGLPVRPWFGANDAYLNRTRHSTEALRNELRKMEAETLYKVRQAWFTLDKAGREEELFSQSIVNLSQAALDVVTSGYESGKVPFADVIASYTSWLTALLSRERSRSDLAIAYSELEEAVGGTLR